MRYIKKEIADLNGKGTTQAYYKIQTQGRIDFEEFVNRCTQHGGMPRSAIVGVISNVVNELAMQIADGYTVKIDGIGTFGGKLGVRRDKEQDTFEEGTEKRNARSLLVTGVSFRADKRLVSLTNRYCHSMERAGESRLRQSEYSPEERLAMAKEYLKTNGVMRIRDYALLTGLSHTTATKELNALSRNPESGIKSRGRRSAKVFVLGS